MGSSPTPEACVDTEDIDEPRPGGVSATEAADRWVARGSVTPVGAEPVPPRHSPVVLVIDVVRMLRGRGLRVAEAVAYSGEALRASADLLRCLGVEPDHFAPRTAVANGPMLAAAATLLRAAGVEPNDIVVWPGRASWPTLPPTDRAVEVVAR